MLVTSGESRSKPGLSALEKSGLWMPLAQVWRASTATSKPGMGYTPGSCGEPGRKERGAVTSEILLLGMME